jgi:hypothetical protein
MRKRPKITEVNEDGTPIDQPAETRSGAFSIPRFYTFPFQGLAR